VANHNLADSVEQFLATQLRAVCARPSGGRRRIAGEAVRQRLLVSLVYPALVRHGYHLPLNVVVDLAYLCLEGTSGIEFRPSQVCPDLDADLVRRYCQALNEAATRGPLCRAVARAAQVTRQARHVRRAEAATTEDQEPRSLLLFLELVAQEIYAQISPPSLPRGLCAALLQASPQSLPPVSFPDEAAIQHIVDFLNQLFPENEEEVRPLSEAFAGDARPLLTAAGAALPSGAEGLDLNVLQAALAYQPLPLTSTQAARWQRLRRTLSPRQHRSA
jgi:hypothetical protein